MGVYSDVALYIYPAQSEEGYDEAAEAAYKTWMVLNKQRIVDLITATGLEISPKFKVDVLATGTLKWYGESVTALREVLNDELVDLPFLSWEIMSVDEGEYVEHRRSNQSAYLLGTRMTFTIAGEDIE
jgi:hypothetical protein